MLCIRAFLFVFTVLHLLLVLCLLFFCFAKRKVTKEKAIFCIRSAAKKGWALLTQFAIGLGGAGFGSLLYYFLAYQSYGALVRYWRCINRITSQKGAIMGYGLGAAIVMV
jgi:hypothetical protein